jgi:hypothetical protein
VCEAIPGIRWWTVAQRVSSPAVAGEVVVELEVMMVPVTTKYDSCSRGYREADRGSGRRLPQCV